MDTRASPAAPPPSYALISRVYRRSLQPVVLSVSVLSCIYAGIWGASAYSDIGDDNTISHNISTLDIVMGSLYMGVLVIELFGIFSAWKQRVPYVRTYCFLSLLAILLVMTAEMMRIVIHFKFKNVIINNCIHVVTTNSDVCKGPFCRDTPLSPQDGKDYCNQQWSRDSFSDIAWFLAASVFAFMFSSFAWAYLHQLLAVGTRLDVGPGVGGAEGRGNHINLQTYTPRYDPPSYPPPRESSEDVHGAGAKVPEYDGYNAGDYVGTDEKAPSYEVSGGQKGHSRTQEEEDEDDEGHGPRVQDSNNPFRKSS